MEKEKAGSTHWIMQALKYRQDVLCNGLTGKPSKITLQFAANRNKIKKDYKTKGNGVRGAVALFLISG